MGYTARPPADVNSKYQKGTRSGGREFVLHIDYSSEDVTFGYPDDLTSSNQQ